MARRQISLDNLPASLPLDHPVERIEQEASVALAHRLIAGRRPMVVPGLAKRWPALQAWSFEWLSQRVGEQEVLVERGNIMQHSSRFEPVRMRDYLLALAEGRKEEGEFRYLASLDLFDRVPEFARDIDFDWLGAALPMQFRFAWVGPVNTVSGYHYDRPDNVVVMIRGRKLIHLVSPDQSAWMYASNKFDYGATLSSVDALAPDLKLHPNFARVRPISVVLEPGDALFIPHHWWHHVVSLDPSISVNCFAYRRSRFLAVEAGEMFKALLHHFRLYATSCTCHQWVDGVRHPKPGKHPLI